MKVYLASDKELFLKEIDRVKKVLRDGGSRGTAEKLDDATNWFDAGVIVLRRQAKPGTYFPFIGQEKAEEIMGEMETLPEWVIAREFLMLAMEKCKENGRVVEIDDPWAL